VAHFAVTAVGADRPGIVAGVTKAFVEVGCNLEDSSMTILRGQFAMMLVVDAPPGVVASDLEAALDAPARALDLVVTVRPAADEAPDRAGHGTGDDATGEGAGDDTGDDTDGRHWTVSVYGADHPGIVHGVASLLAGLGVNIVDLSTRVVGDDTVPVYTMVLRVTLPPGTDPGGLSRRLEATAAELGVTCRLHPSEADIL
jgi:glycine cleavage system transcriptional repressor